MALTIANADAAERFIAFTPEKGYWKADICNMRILVDRNEDKAILHALENLISLDRWVRLHPVGEKPIIIYKIMLFHIVNFRLCET